VPPVPGCKAPPVDDFGGTYVMPEVTIILYTSKYFYNKSFTKIAKDTHLCVIWF
jgi:hypothetical protein